MEAKTGNHPEFVIKVLSGPFDRGAVGVLMTCLVLGCSLFAQDTAKPGRIERPNFLNADMGEGNGPTEVNP